LYGGLAMAWDATSAKPKIRSEKFLAA
jgi:hypothetical protein